MSEFKNKIKQASAGKADQAAFKYLGFHAVVAVTLAIVGFLIVAIFNSPSSPPPSSKPYSAEEELERQLRLDRIHRERAQAAQEVRMEKYREEYRNR